ncbi:hypothetical protein MLD38_021077 [Melastoma candidum]|uniref:Uncharacterized protein n=1 Tax=Melastoma candidum TaxID=119954 RepID=A0ACB9QE87_9MYRT|nr:hypothetical protein MLD38_021077 [Melastoma candidum]
MFRAVASVLTQVDEGTRSARLLLQLLVVEDIQRSYSSIKGKTVREALKTFRITDPGLHIMFPFPSTFITHTLSRLYEIVWKSRIFAFTDSFVVLNEPAGTSAGGTANKFEERCATFATRALGLVKPLRTTHQIDNSEG